MASQATVLGVNVGWMEVLWFLFREGCTQNWWPAFRQPEGKSVVLPASTGSGAQPARAAVRVSSQPAGSL